MPTQLNESAIQQSTIIVNPKGVTQVRFLVWKSLRIFAFGPDAMPTGRADDYLTPEPDEGFEAIAGTRPPWKGLLRSGTNARREGRENIFCPVLVDANGERLWVQVILSPSMARPMDGVMPDCGLHS